MEQNFLGAGSRVSLNNNRSDLMRSSLLLGGLLSSVVIVTAFAQANPPAPPAATPAPSATTTTTTASTSTTWRASKMVGVNVYNDQDEKLGSISEVLIDKSGKVDGVIIGVGGFLGMGQHDIKVELSKLKFVDEPVRSSAAGSTSTTGAGPGAGANRPATTTSSTASSGKKWYPDHAVLSGASKDQLKAMPEFKFD
jgi:sporulation protein YlmC with PRC-barrel domain